MSFSAIRHSLRSSKPLQTRSFSALSVILLEDLQNQGTRGDVVKVSGGFARNFLFPNRLAVYNTQENREKLGDLKSTPFEPYVNEPLRDYIKQHGNVFRFNRLIEDEASLVYPLKPKDLNKFFKSKGIPPLRRSTFISAIKYPGLHTITVDGSEIVLKIVAYTYEDLMDFGYNPFGQFKNNTSPQESLLPTDAF